MILGVIFDYEVGWCLMERVAVGIGKVRNV